MSRFNVGDGTPLSVITNALDGTSTIAARLRALAHAVRTMDESMDDQNHVLDVMYDYANNIMTLCEGAELAARDLCDEAEKRAETPPTVSTPPKVAAKAVRT